MRQAEAVQTILRVLHKMDGEPMPAEVLLTSIRMMHSGDRVTDGDLYSYIRTAEGMGYITGTKDEILGVLWVLTTKGKIKAQAL